MNIQSYQKYYDSVEANIILSKLQANGIPCFMTNEHSATTLWHLTPAHGGVDIMMDRKYFGQADEILNIESSQEDQIEDVASDLQCPKCGSSNGLLGPGKTHRINWWQIILSLLTAGIAPVYQKAYHCFECGEDFR